MEGRSVRSRGGNVFVELQNRQWVPAEQWNWQLLHRYCEGRTIQRLRNHVGRIGSRPQTSFLHDAPSRVSEDSPRATDGGLGGESLGIVNWAIPFINHTPP